MIKKLLASAAIVAVSAMPALANDWTVEWPMGGSAESVEFVQIKNSVTPYRYLSSEVDVKLLDAEGETVRTLVRDDITLSYKSSYCTAEFEFNPAVSTPGTYTISVGEGTFKTNDMVPNEAFSVNFTVTEPTELEVVNAEWTCMMPENGTAESLQELILTSDYQWDVVTETASAMVLDASFQPVAMLTKDNFGCMGGMVAVMLESPITTPGQYALMINARSFNCTSANVTNGDALIMLTVEAPEPPAPVDESADWTMEWPMGGSAESVEFVQIKNSVTPYRYLSSEVDVKLLDAEGATVRTLVRDDITLSYKSSYCTAEFEFNPAITTPGTYTISVGAGTFKTTDMEPGNPFSVNFTVTEPAELEVVNAEWTCMMPENGTAESLQELILTSDYQWDVVTESASAMVLDASFQPVAMLTKDNFGCMGGMVAVMLESPITTPGQYALMINARSFNCTSANVTNGDALIMLTVEAPEPPQEEFEVTCTPEDNSSVSNTIGIEMIMVTIAGYHYNSPNTSGICATITKNGEHYATVDASALVMAMDRTSACLDLEGPNAINTVGEYVVTMPSGYMCLTKDGSDAEVLVDSPEIVLHYTITAPAENLSWTAEPADLSTVTELDTVTLTFNKKVKVANTQYVQLFYTNYSGFQDNVTEGVISVSEDGLTATIQFSPVFTSGGVFQVRLFEGNEQLSVVDGEYFPGIRLTYKIDAPLYTECTPAAGSVLNSIDQTKVVLPRNIHVATADDFQAWYVCGEEKVEAELVSIVEYDFGTPSCIVVAPQSPIVTPGEWKLQFPAGALTISNYGESIASALTEIPFTIEGGFSYEMTPSVDEYLTSLSNFALTFHYVESDEIDTEKNATFELAYDFYGMEKVDITQNMIVKKADAVNAMDNPVTYYMSVSDVDEINAKLSEYPNRAYTMRVTIPEGMFTINGVAWDGAVFNYTKHDNTFSSVAGLMTDGDSADVYSLQGICVLRNATPADLTKLPAGLYIVNGRKVMVK